MTRTGVPQRRPNQDGADWMEARRLHEKGAADPQIASWIGVSLAAVQVWRELLGLPPGKGLKPSSSEG